MLRIQIGIGAAVLFLAVVAATELEGSPVEIVSAPALPSTASTWGQAVPYDLSGVDEDALLAAGGKARLLPVAPSLHAVDRRIPPVVLVHGISGGPADLQPIVNRLRDQNVQLFVLCYDDRGRRTSLNGLDLAVQLRRLAGWLAPTQRRLTIVAHSMGGIVARMALNDLVVGPEGGIGHFFGVRLLAVDTPWHGFPGPSDQGIDGLLMDAIRPLMDDGLEDMRARSAMFVGDPHSRSATLKAGLWGVQLPARVQIGLVFAQRGGQASDWTEEPLRGLPRKLARYYESAQPLRLSPRQRNFWCAIHASTKARSLRYQLRGLAAAGDLDAAGVRDALARFYPRYDGDHVSVLSTPELHMVIERLLPSSAR